MQTVNRIRATRESLGLSRYRLAQLTGISEPNLMRLEQRVISPRWPTLCRIANALGCFPADLLPEAHDAHR